MIVPTLRCDHDCRYCQVSRVPVNKPNYDLDEDYISKILNFISSVSTDDIKIEFQGGGAITGIQICKNFCKSCKRRVC